MPLKRIAQLVLSVSKMAAYLFSLVTTHRFYLTTVGLFTAMFKTACVVLQTQ